jgi:hypothetical protein
MPSRADGDGWQVVNPRDRGVGFAKFENEGDYVIGRYVGDWEGKAGRVVNLCVSEITAPVVTKNGDGRDERITAQAGDIVYVGAHTADLRGKLTDELEGREVYVEFVGTKPVKQGTLKLFQVKSRPSAKDDQENDDEDLPF